MRNPLTEVGRTSIPYDMSIAQSARMGPAALGQGIERGASNAYRAYRDQERLNQEIQNQRFQQTAELWKQQQYEMKARAMQVEMGLDAQKLQLDMQKDAFDQIRKARDSDRKDADWKLRAFSQSDRVHQDEEGKFHRLLPRGGGGFNMRRVYGDQAELKGRYEKQNQKGGKERDLLSQMGSLSQTRRNMQPSFPGMEDPADKARTDRIDTALDQLLDQLTGGKGDAQGVPKEREAKLKKLRDLMERFGAKR